MSISVWAQVAIFTQVWVLRYEMYRSFRGLTGSQRTLRFWGVTDISLSKDKNISKGTQEMLIIQNDKSLKDNNPLKDKLLPKGENLDDIIFFPEKKKTENTTINASSFILFDIEIKYLNLS